MLAELLPAPRGETAEAAAPTVVDFGCGSGNLTLPLAALMPYVRFVGVGVESYMYRSLEVEK